jgi:hypothetical protein
MLAAIEAISAKQTHRIREFIFIRFWVQGSGFRGLGARVQSFTVKINLSGDP